MSTWKVLKGHYGRMVDGVWVQEPATVIATGVSKARADSLMRKHGMDTYAVPEEDAKVEGPCPCGGLISSLRDGFRRCDVHVEEDWVD
jgi:hypothetical protein